MKLDGTLLEPLRQYVTDKEYVKDYVATIVGREYTIKTYRIVRCADQVYDLDLQCFPCVVKPTHMSGMVLVCADRSINVDRDLLKEWLQKSYYKQSREANYRYLKPKIIVEEFFSEDGKNPPKDYKIFCFHGYPQLIQVDADRFVNHTRNFYDIAWNRLQVVVNYPARLSNDPKPQKLDLMLDVAEQLSKPFSFVRVDMYACDDQIKVGELTNCHGSAIEPIRPNVAEEWLGRLFGQSASGRSSPLCNELYAERTTRDQGPDGNDGATA